MENTKTIKNEKAEQHLDDALNEIEIQNTVTSVIARSEALKMLGNIINAFLAVTQKTDAKLSPEQLGAIQEAINKEAKETRDSYNKVIKVTNDFFGKKDKGLNNNG